MDAKTDKSAGKCPFTGVVVGDFGHYGGLFIRMAWHSVGTYRITDGRGGAGAGQQHPLNGWRTTRISTRRAVSCGRSSRNMAARFPGPTLIILTGNVALESMGFKAFGFAGGRADVWEPEARARGWATRGAKLGSKTTASLELEAGAKGSPSRRPYRVTKPVSRVLYRAAKRGDGHSSRASLAARLMQPTRAAHLKADWKRSPASTPPLFGLAPGGVCRAAFVTKDAVRSYRTLSPLPSFAKAMEGGLLSVALSLGSPPPEVIRHRASWSPDFPLRHTRYFQAERPSGLLTTVIRGFGEVPSSAEGFDCRAFLPAGLPARNGILIASLPYIPIS